MVDGPQLQNNEHVPDWDLDEKCEKLDVQLRSLYAKTIAALDMNGGAMYMLDLIMIGAVKRTTAIGRGLQAMVDAKNMLGARAMLRMQIDTVSRLLAYTYVDDPDQLALHVLGGERLSSFKDRTGKNLRDGYLIEKLNKRHSWAKEVYNRTSAEVHFSEKQVFASVASMDDQSPESVSFSFRISEEDDNYPEWSWGEVVSCYVALHEIFEEILISWGEKKRAMGEPVPGPSN